VEKILNQTQLIKILEKVRKNKKVVFTNGCFDILHVGHVRYLHQARALGDLLVVAINTDASVKKLKGEQRPIQTEKDRAEIMAALECVSFVTLFAEETPEDLIRALKPDILVKGGDWKEDQIVGSGFVKSYGGTVKSLPYVEGKSTTNILKKI